MQFPFSIYPLGDSALTVDFGNSIDEALNRNVLSLFRQLQNLSPFIKDVVPAYSSLTVYYDVGALHNEHQTVFSIVKASVLSLLEESRDQHLPAGRQIRIPVCYEKKYAPDLDELARQRQVSVEDVVRLHTAISYRVYMIGFLPGFAYMGTVDERIATPRREQPRTIVPAGAVGIAGQQTGIYPLPSPGGWNLVGQTPVKLFDANREESVLLQPGDTVQFYSITQDEFENYQGGHS